MAVSRSRPSETSGSANPSRVSPNSRSILATDVEHERRFPTGRARRRQSVEQIEIDDLDDSGAELDRPPARPRRAHTAAHRQPPVGQHAAARLDRSPVARRRRPLGRDPRFRSRRGDLPQHHVPGRLRRRGRDRDLRRIAAGLAFPREALRALRPRRAARRPLDRRRGARGLQHAHGRRVRLLRDDPSVPGARRDTVLEDPALLGARDRSSSLGALRCARASAGAPTPIPRTR